ncbi:glucosamine-6-phosphate deaminase [Kribbella catacumbae]|uniref:glucosamine-6-phosphate deaminase n=1 Tax=Kribbella catacumbae TaxID=460086 RepID=UPI00038175F9|nr:glucosamine-6-phosphate deaminase [Kribbella catacumbae]
MTGLPWVRIYPDRQVLGHAAARDIAAELRRLLDGQDKVRILFASAPSQYETLTALCAEPGIDWRRISAFQLDEYLGLSPDAPQRFGRWLRRTLFDRVPVGEVNLMDSTDDIDGLLADYAGKLSEAPIDIACLGLGVNGHLAFNDPAVADFHDPLAVKVVDLDEVSRQQQVDDECFTTIDDVPRQAVTLTIPTLLTARRIFCVVPGSPKARAVRAALLDALSTESPGTILRTHPGCVLYLDRDSALEVRQEIAG